MRVGDEEAGAQRGRPFFAQRAPDHRGRPVGRDAVNALIGGRYVLPDWQQQPGQQVELGRGGFGKGSSLFTPEPRKLRPVDLFPSRGLKPRLLQIARPVGPHRLAHQRDHVLVIHLHGPRRDERRATGGAIHHRQLVGIARHGLFGAQDMDWVRHLEPDDPRHRAGFRAGPEILCGDLFDLFATQGFHAEIERARRPRPLRLISDPPHEFRKERVLHVDGQGKHPVEKPLDRGKLLKEHPVLVDQPQGRPVGEALVAHRLSAPGGKIGEIPTQRRPRGRAFEIVLLAEHALRAGLALALGQGPQLVEALSYSRGEAFFAMHIRGADPEEGRADLSRAMRAAQPLDGRICAPAGLQ